ncbi:MAG: hypothetical protein KGZ88_09480 [Methylomicrobium sp.]|nr:hypothetical protein [Methylomicrobium sp.]
MLNIGNIEFTSASGPIKEVTLLHIKNADSLKERIRQFKGL